MNSFEIDSFLSTITNLRALVIGDLMLDEYVLGKTERISPEAPVPVVDVVSEDVRLGGAGNVASNLLSLGCQVAVVSVVGDDHDGRKIRQMVNDLAINTDGIFLDNNRSTTRKTRILANNQQMLRIDKESRADIDVETEKWLIDYIEALDSDFQVILVSDYLKGVLTEKILRAIFELGQKCGIPVVVDPKGKTYSKYRGATLLTPNRKEVELATGIQITDEASLLYTGNRLVLDLKLEALVITRSEEGMTVFTQEGVSHFSTKAREVFDVTGAGDTVLAFLGLGLAAGLSMKDSVWLSNIGAGVVVGKIGTSSVTPVEVLDATRQQHPNIDQKVKTSEELTAILDQKRIQGKKVVFTNGCFDLLHVGHVKYLQQARQLGDLLVLGLNSDDSIRRLKGDKRPLLEEMERAQILAALDCVDYIVIFDEDTPLGLISSLKPQVLVKGGDYLPDEVVGKNIVESYGGCVELITFVDGKSTTNIIESILSRYGNEW